MYNVYIIIYDTILYNDNIIYTLSCSRVGSFVVPLRRGGAAVSQG